MSNILSSEAFKMALEQGLICDKNIVQDEFDTQSAPSFNTNTSFRVSRRKIKKTITKLEKTGSKRHWWTRFLKSPLWRKYEFEEICSVLGIIDRDERPSKPMQPPNLNSDIVPLIVYPVNVDGGGVERQLEVVEEVITPQMMNRTEGPVDYTNEMVARMRLIEDKFEEIHFKRDSITQTVKLLCRGKNGKNVLFDDIFKIPEDTEENVLIDDISKSSENKKKRTYYIYKRLCPVFLKIRLIGKIVIEVKEVHTGQIRVQYSKKAKDTGMSKTIFKNNLGRYFELVEEDWIRE